MGSDVSSQSLLGLAGLASLCCVGPGTAAIAGGTSVGMIAGVVQGSGDLRSAQRHRVAAPASVEPFVFGP